VKPVPAPRLPLFEWLGFVAVVLLEVNRDVEVAVEQRMCKCI
jgi:hypothetical protein